MEKKLVSIITPCYNGEKYLDQYFNSLLSQTYTNCQIIFIDDGSVDNTKKIVTKYKKDIEKKGMTLEYYYQENKGIGGAISEGIKHIKGEYFIWPDVDDIITPDSISKRVEFLEKNKDYGSVRSECRVVYENDLDNTIEFSAEKNNNKFKESLFLNCLLMKNFYYQPGPYMVRTSSLLKINPKRYIYPSRVGQNIQMLLPILYKEKCGYIDEPLFIYIKHQKSLSMSVKQEYKELLKRQEDMREIVINTINNTLIEQKDKYIFMSNIEFLKREIDLAFQYNKNDELIRLYQILTKEYKYFSIKYFLKVKLCNNLFFRKILKSRFKIIKKIRRKRNEK